MAQPIQPPTLGQKLLMWGTNTAAFNWLDSKITPAAKTIETAKGTISTAVKSIPKAIEATGEGAASGLKWGLIIGGAILALFLVAQMKSLTAAFKE